MTGDSYYFLGIGGSGMSALAHVLLARGASVKGSDRAVGPVLDSLRSMGADVEVGHRAEHLSTPCTLVVSAAIPEGNPILAAARATGCSIITRAELLGQLMHDRPSVAITGTHGKSTTTGMLSHLMRRCGFDPTIMIGADLPEIGGNAWPGHDDLVIAEVCEAYDSFLSVHPRYAIVTNVEPDHLDYYHSFDRLKASFRTFVRQIDPNGSIVVCADDPGAIEIAREYEGRMVTYGFDPGADVRAECLQPFRDGVRFIIRSNGESREAILQVPGRHNVLNAVAALTMGFLLGVPWSEAIAGLADFRGVGRRLELVGEGGGVLVYDDYAHHPTEIRETLHALRGPGASQRLIALFQPHLYSRTREFLDDFAGAFAEADLALFMEIYGARESPIQGVNGCLLAERAEQVRPDATTEFVGTHPSAVRRVLSLVAPGDTVVCLGAGDITHTAREIGRRIGSPALHGEERE